MFMDLIHSILTFKMMMLSWMMFRTSMMIFYDMMIGFVLTMNHVRYDFRGNSTCDLICDSGFDFLTLVQYRWPCLRNIINTMFVRRQRLDHVFDVNSLFTRLITKLRIWMNFVNRRGWRNRLSLTQQFRLVSPRSNLTKNFPRVFNY